MGSGEEWRLCRAYWSQRVSNPGSILRHSTNPQLAPVLPNSTHSLVGILTFEEECLQSLALSVYHGVESSPHPVITIITPILWLRHWFRDDKCLIWHGMTCMYQFGFESSNQNFSPKLSLNINASQSKNVIWDLCTYYLESLLQISRQITWPTFPKSCSGAYRGGPGKNQTLGAQHIKVSVELSIRRPWCGPSWGLFYINKK